MTLIATILAGVTIFVLGQIILKWMIEPIQELRKLKGEILFHLANDHATIHNAKIVEKEAVLEVKRTLERLGASLLSNQHLIPMYSRIQRLFQLPDGEKIQFAAGRLRLISNSLFSEADDLNFRLDLYRREVCAALDIEDPIKEKE